MKKFAFCLGTMLFVLNSFSQTNYSIFGSYIHNTNRYYKNNTKGVGICLEFGGRHTTSSKYLSFSYAFPMYVVEELEADASSYSTTPRSIPVTAKYKRPMVQIESGGRWYFSGEAENRKAINWYLNVGGEAIVNINKPTYSSYDTEKYSLGFSEGSSCNPDGTEKYGISVNICAGTGIEKNLGIGNLFLQTSFSLPVKWTGEFASFKMAPLSISLGYKIIMRKK